jgi:hypothetical protein
MSLPYGDWKATVNGAETILHIDPPDAQGVCRSRWCYEPGVRDL